MCRLFSASLLLNFVALTTAYGFTGQTLTVPHIGLAAAFVILVMTEILRLAKVPTNEDPLSPAPLNILTRR